MCENSLSNSLLLLTLKVSPQLASFGALATSVITTVRKVLQIVISFIIFKHSFTPMQLVGLAVSFLGIYVNVHLKKQNHDAKQKPKQSPHARYSSGLSRSKSHNSDGNLLGRNEGGTSSMLNISSQLDGTSSEGELMPEGRKPGQAATSSQGKYSGPI